MSEELKPCPFCGASAKPPYKESEKGRPIWWVGCKIYCVSMRRGSKKEAIEDWNSRAENKELSHTKARLEEAERLLELIKEDLLIRADVTSDGQTAVNLSHSYWIKLNRFLTNQNTE